MKKINLGVLGTGMVAAGLTRMILSRMDEVNLYAVGSRSKEKAEAFGKELGYERAYGSYEELVADDQIDLVYIATPNSEHLKHIRLCAEHGRNILVEKSFTLSKSEAEDAVAIAKLHGVLLAEAIWIRYLPLAKRIEEVVRSGRLGEIRSVDTSLCFNVWHRQRVHEKALGGGALLDLGVYCLNFIDMAIGTNFKDLKVVADVDPTEGTDRSLSVILDYGKGVTASFQASLLTGTDRRGVIRGTEGYGVLDDLDGFNSFSIYTNKGELQETIEAPNCTCGYEYEFRECAEALEKGLREVESAPLERSLRIMGAMDRIRREMGVVYPME